MESVREVINLRFDEMNLVQSEEQGDKFTLRIVGSGHTIDFDIDASSLLPFAFILVAGRRVYETAVN